MIDFTSHLIEESAKILVALQKLNENPTNLTLFVTDEMGRMVGTLTDGDIRRGFLKGLQLDETVDKFMASSFQFLNDKEVTPAQIKEIKNRGVKLIPVLGYDGCIQGIIDFNKVKTILPLDVVLMAGGRGERLRPLTDTVPKPLLPVGNKPIIEHNIDHLRQYGIRNFYIAIRYLGDMIKNYFGDGQKKEIAVQYVREEEPLGTFGALSLISHYQHRHVLVMNSDLFTDLDVENFYQDFVDQDADMAIASVPYVVDIPYAVLNLYNGQVQGFKEKPTYTYYANAGIYLIKKEFLKTIPSHTRYDATDFIQSMIDSGKKVIRYPLLGYWIDIGKPEDYQKVQEIVKHIRL